MINIFLACVSIWILLQISPFVALIVGIFLFVLFVAIKSFSNLLNSENIDSSTSNYSKEEILNEAHVTSGELLKDLKFLKSQCDLVKTNDDLILEFKISFLNKIKILKVTDSKYFLTRIFELDCSTVFSNIELQYIKNTIEKNNPISFQEKRSTRDSHVVINGKTYPFTHSWLFALYQKMNSYEKMIIEIRKYYPSLSIEEKDIEKILKK